MAPVVIGARGDSAGTTHALHIADRDQIAAEIADLD
jgi:hypothetical protein